MADSVVEAFRTRILQGQPLRLRGGGSKDFYGGPLNGEVLDVGAHRGIVNYEPTELVITARCGTPLAELKSALAARRQYLPFEPPSFGGAATLGGMVAAGLSGPRRASVGAVRDFVLGVTMLDGNGRHLKFGGEVMKNVAGYDVSRLMCGSLGTLGLLLDVSLKVLPQPVAEATLLLEMRQADALDRMNRWGGQPLPISATCWHDNVLSVRLSGAAAAVRAAQAALGGELLAETEAAAFWTTICEQTHDFFAGDAPLWRVSAPSVAPPFASSGPQLIEWGGALRWLRGDLDGAQLRAAASKVSAGTHSAGVTAFRGTDRAQGVFPPPSPGVLNLHRQLKQRFDPHGVFGPGRLYPEF